MPRKRKTRLRRGDVISAKGSIIQIVKFERNTIIGRHLGSSEVCQVDPSHVQVNLSQIGATEQRFRQRQRTHWNFTENTPIEVKSVSSGKWCVGKITKRFLVAENPEVVHDLWFQVEYFSERYGKIRYKQLKYDDHTQLQQVCLLADSPHWEHLGFTPDEIISYRTLEVNLDLPDSHEPPPSNVSSHAEN